MRDRMMSLVVLWNHPLLLKESSKQISSAISVMALLKDFEEHWLLSSRS
jgi:hypothetical protein